MNYLLNFRNHNNNSGGPVVPGRIEQSSEIDTPLGTENHLRREPRITFLIHGYNVNKRAGQRSLLQLATHLAASSDSASVMTLWPGDDPRLSFSSYPIEGRDADDTAAELVRFVDRVVMPGAELSFVSHSLGARVALESAKRLKGHKVKIAHICLLAAAVDDICLASPAAYRDVALSATRIVILASEGDRVLRLAYPAGDFLEQFFFADQIAGKALGFRGPKPYKGLGIPSQVQHVQLALAQKVDHGDYFPGDPETTKQVAAVKFAGAVLQGTEPLSYSGAR